MIHKIEDQRNAPSASVNPVKACLDPGHCTPNGMPPPLSLREVWWGDFVADVGSDCFIGAILFNYLLAFLGGGLVCGLQFALAGARGSFVAITALVGGSLALPLAWWRGASNVRGPRYLVEGDLASAWKPFRASRVAAVSSETKRTTVRLLSAVNRFNRALVECEVLAEHLALTARQADAAHLVESMLEGRRHLARAVALLGNRIRGESMGVLLESDTKSINHIVESCITADDVKGGVEATVSSLLADVEAQLSVVQEMRQAQGELE